MRGNPGRKDRNDNEYRHDDQPDDGKTIHLICHRDTETRRKLEKESDITLEAKIVPAFGPMLSGFPSLRLRASVA